MGKKVLNINELPSNNPERFGQKPQLSQKSGGKKPGLSQKPYEKKPTFTQKPEEVMPCPIKLETLVSYWELMLQHYTKDQKRMKLLEAIDNGDLWKALKVKFPAYQILPDTNFISYVKSNIVSSLYTVTKGASVTPTSDDDKQICMDINIALERIWGLSSVGFYQFLAGSNAALHNVGFTRVGWDENLTAGSANSFYKGNVSFKNISPLKFMRDPFATELDTAGYCVEYDSYHKSVFEANYLYKDAFSIYKHKSDSKTVVIPEEVGTPSKSNAKDYYTLHTYWVKERRRLYEIHVINNEEVLYWKEIKPAEFPIAELYCEHPGDKIIGGSPCSKIFANNAAYNIMQSVALTSEYRNQRPPKFVSNYSGLNIRAFSKYGDDADKTFLVKGDASRAVHYQMFPQLSAMYGNMQFNLTKDIQRVSSVDDRYTGRNTGSITTTGGTEEMLNRVTLIDTPKILMYEKYVKRLTQLTLLNLLEYCPKRSYLRKDPKRPTQLKSIEVNFPEINSETLFQYECNVSSELPKNKQRIAEWANMMMEKQAQYKQQGSTVTWITEEEWLEMQDVPNKERMLERMGMQRMDDAVEEVSQALFTYADLIAKGATPEDAIMASAQGLEQKRNGSLEGENPINVMGNTQPQM